MHLPDVGSDQPYQPVKKKLSNFCGSFSAEKEPTGDRDATRVSHGDRDATKASTEEGRRGRWQCRTEARTWGTAGRSPCYKEEFHTGDRSHLARPLRRVQLTKTSQPRIGIWLKGKTLESTLKVSINTTLPTCDDKGVFTMMIMTHTGNTSNPVV